MQIENSINNTIKKNRNSNIIMFAKAFRDLNLLRKLLYPVIEF